MNNTPHNRNHLRRLLVTLVKIVIGVALVVLLFRKQDVRLSMIVDAAIHLFTHPVWLVATLLLVLGCLLAGAIRWWTALRGLDVPLSRKRVIAIFFIGHFFNGFLPGTTGGDVARAVYAARGVPAHKPEAVMSIMIERLAGIAMLLLLTIAGLLASPEHCHLHMAMILLIGATSLILIMLLALPDMQHFAAWPGLRQIARHPRLGPVVVRLYTALRLCQTRRVLALELLGWSLLQHACAIASWLTLAYGFGLTFRVVPFLLLIPAVLTAQMIPLTLGGLGVREGAAASLLPGAGIHPQVAVLVALASYAASLVWSAAGGLIFVALGEHHHARPDLDSPAQGE